MVRFHYYAVLGLSALAQAAPHASKKRAPLVKSGIAQVPQDWVLHRTPPAHHPIKLRIGLPQSNFPELQRTLFEVSDPSHSRYGAHLSKEEVEALISPHPESLDVVDEWLASHGFDIDALERSPANDWITVVVPVHQAESMLNTKYHVYKHEHSGAEIVRTQSYSLPEYLHPHIDVIQPTTMFGNGMRPRKVISHVNKLMKATDTNATDCANRVTVKCLQDLYNTTGYTPKATDKNTLGITGYVISLECLEVTAHAIPINQDT